MNQVLVIADTTIRQDAEGRYCLNDLHRAAGGLDRDKPDNFLRSKKVQEYLAYLCCPEMRSIIPVGTILGKGRMQGTYVIEELVYEYAAWISNEFKHRVWQAYKALVRGQLETAYSIATRRSTKDGHIKLCENLMATRLEAGKETPAYIYMNESNMLNRIILGMTAKEFLSARGLDQTEITRDLLTHDQLKAFDELQSVDASLVALGEDYETRKVKLQDLFNRRHAIALIAEFEMMNLNKTA